MSAGRPWLLALACTLLCQAGAYTVQRGDTLSSIARRHGTSVSALMAVNHLTSTVIVPGQQLQVALNVTPPQGAAQAPTTPATTSVYQRGYAVYYGGRRDAQTRMTAAHLSLPFGTWVQVTHQRTGRSVTVKINDRGPFNGGGRIIDLSTAAAQALGITREGVAPVTLRILSQP
ncbi:septal ring lytic transglycosylase RlpA family protein [Deinococcus sp. VB343]|uniref:septal ring lytic transglycosylase RlpA family protein n=1 Tax=Deinococcus sp. VB343 TaxID=3385567 RepID=UPI0039C9C957